MALKNMAVPEENEALESNPYGYGLCIRLNPKQCEILGLSTPAAGTVLSLRAMAVATCVTQEVDVGDDDQELYLELQITDLEVGNASSSNKSASMLYGSDKD